MTLGLCSQLGGVSQGPTVGLSCLICKMGTWRELAGVFSTALALRFPGGGIEVPSLAARDKQEADENNSAGSWAVSGRAEKTELPSHRPITPAAYVPVLPLSLLNLCPEIQTSACLQCISVQHADPSLLYHLLWLPTTVRTTSRDTLLAILNAFSLIGFIHQNFVLPNASPFDVSEDIPSASMPFLPNCYQTPIHPLEP